MRNRGRDLRRGAAPGRARPRPGGVAASVAAEGPRRGPGAGLAPRTPRTSAAVLPPGRGSPGPRRALAPGSPDLAPSDGPAARAADPRRRSMAAAGHAPTPRTSPVEMARGLGSPLRRSWRSRAARVQRQVVRVLAAARRKRAAPAIIAALSVQSSIGGTQTGTPSCLDRRPQLGVGRHAAADRQPLQALALERRSACGPPAPPRSRAGRRRPGRPRSASGSSRRR